MDWFQLQAKKKKNKLKGKTKGIQEYAHLTGVQTHR